MYTTARILIALFAFQAAGTFAQAPLPVVIDNADAGFSTSAVWNTGTSAAGKYGADYRFADNTGNPAGAPTHVATWTAPISETGFYDVAVQYPQGNNRAPDAPFTITTDYGSHTVRIDQRINGGQFNSLGTFHWDSGQSAVVSLGNNASPSVVIADAVRLSRITTETANNEYRLFWVSRFQWPSSNQSTAQANINNVFQTAADYNFNAVFFQVRGQMDTHYPSPLEPWTNTYGWSNPGWDPLQYAINSAHSRGIELHAYFNTHTLASPIPPGNTTPQHQYNLHGPGAPAGAERWDAHNIFGNPMGNTDGYIWLSPGVPNASLHTRRALMHLVENYDVDGVHFDRIRTSEHESSYDPVSVARFEGDGNPDDLTYPEFMKDQITRDLRKLYAAVNAVKPDVVLSAAPIGISERNSSTQYQGTGSAAQYNYNQDAWAWLQAGVMDFVVPQIYWEINSNHPHEKLLADWVTNAGERWIVPGSRTDKTVASQGPKPLAGLLGEWQTSVDQGAAGKCYWQWQSLGNTPPGEFQSYYEALKTGPYKNKVSPPEMPWKANPGTGFITGYVKAATGAPVVDARVKLTGSDYTYLSGADGYYAILDVAPGTTHTLTATKYGSGSSIVENITVTAGSETTQQLTLAGSHGFAEFFRTRYYHEDEVTVRLYDIGLAGSSVALVEVHSPVDPVGETIALTPDGSQGRFQGTFRLSVTTNAPGDQILRALPGNRITVQYLDTHVPTPGGTVSRLFISEATVRIPGDIILESRNPRGSTTLAPAYSETGTWANTGTVGPNNIVIKSSAPGLTGLGGRTSSATGSSFRFQFDVPVSGHYDVYITLPGTDRSTDYAAPGTGVSVQGTEGTTNRTIDLSSSNPAVAGKWLLLESEKVFSPGSTSAIQVQNNNATSGPTQQFGADAVKLEFRRPVGVNSAVDSWKEF